MGTRQVRPQSAAAHVSGRAGGLLTRRSQRGHHREWQERLSGVEHRRMGGAAARAPRFLGAAAAARRSRKRDGHRTPFGPFARPPGGRNFALGREAEVPTSRYLTEMQAMGECLLSGTAEVNETAREMPMSRWSPVWR